MPNLTLIDYAQMILVNLNIPNVKNRGQIPQDAFGRMKVLAKYSVQERLLQREDKSIIILYRQTCIMIYILV